MQWKPRTKLAVWPMHARNCSPFISFDVMGWPSLGLQMFVKLCTLICSPLFYAAMSILFHSYLLYSPESKYANNGIHHYEKRELVYNLRWWKWTKYEKSPHMLSREGDLICRQIFFEFLENRSSYSIALLYQKLAVLEKISLASAATTLTMVRILTIMQPASGY